MSDQQRSVSFAAGTAMNENINDTGATSFNAAAASSTYHSGMVLYCPNCGSTDLEQPTQTSSGTGASVCVACGVVVEDNAIVSAVEFVEGAGGASSMVGQFVSATSSKAYTAGGGGRGGMGSTVGRFGFSRDSRETTLANGRRRIQDVASRLRLGSTFIDAAHRLFTVAVEKNFVQGRRTTHVVAACLYIACRQEKSQHMLIDFSDVLQVNVYTLGTTFLKFRRLLGLKLEIIDPALYIYRFAAHLGLDKKANAVAMTALRLVGRMKRDWIVAGRRPAGICAAALLIAARAHGFSRDHQDVTRILRVCGLTVSTRIKEFEQTPSAKLTLETFGQVDLESEADPPVFTRNKMLEARAKAIQNGNVELLTSGALDNPAEGKRATLWRATHQRRNPNRELHSELYSALEKELAEAGSAPASGEKSLVDLEIKTVDDNADDDFNKKPAAVDATSKSMVLYSGHDVSTLPDEMKTIYPRNRSGKAIVLPDYCTAEELQVSLVPTESKISLSEFKQDLPESIDLEIDSLFRSEEEERQKEVIFNKLNKDYLVQQQRKESDRLTAEANSKAMEKEDMVQVQGQARYRTRRGNGDNDGAPPTTEEQLLAAMATRKVSRKINYDAMSSIFDEDGSFAMDGGTGGDATAENEFEMI
ncbi:hypothetical protein MPSEU_000840400 [Mayamaea pseudoterrestris]|nr:hypothetical protein MPSEU_000840400 [Mayamaea pseudoterrestris]